MESTTPRLHVAPADPAAKYAPLSWYACASLGIAVLFAVLLLSFGFFAFREGKPMIENWLFLFPILGIVLAFAGRRHIRESEGTRTGERYANAGWWICVVGGLGYAAYLVGVEFTIRQDANAQFTKWSEHLKEADTTNPNDPATANAFYFTISPGQRANLSASDTVQMRARFGTEFTLFRQTKLLTILARNKGQCEFVSDGLQGWEQTPGKIECTLAVTLKTPEGDFPLVIPMVAETGTKGRAWKIAMADGYVAEGPGKPPVPRTEYGWWMEKLQFSAMQAMSMTIEEAKTNPNGKMPELTLLAPESSRTGTPLTPKDLEFCWKYAAVGTLAPPGVNLSHAPEQNPLMLLFADHIEVRVPVELQPRGAERGTAARGRLVFRLEDPKLLEEIRTAQANAKTSPRTSAMPEAIAKMPIPWKLIRLESNLKVEAKPAGPPQGR